MNYWVSLDVLYLIGTASFTISGYLIGARKHFDLLGIVILALLTAIGGGVIRDVLINRLPQVFVDITPLYTIFAALMVAWLIKLQQKNSGLLFKVFIVADSIGLVAFSLAGAQLGIDLQLNAFGVCALSFITAIGGGLVRDMMVNDVPFILHEDFYGTVSILMAVLLLVAQRSGLTGAWVMWALFGVGLALRLIAHKSAFSLPKVS